MKRKILWIVVGVILVIMLTGSGWVYNIVKSNSLLIQNNEMATLQTTFVQQYGSQASIKQLVAPEKVYAALWTDANGDSHISWNIGGMWAVLWSCSSKVTSP